MRDLLPQLFARGLGDLLILHSGQQTVCLGNLTFVKGRLILKDTRLLSGLTPVQVQSCFEDGIIGMVSDSVGQEWESMSFYGVDQCRLPVDMGKTRHGALCAAQNQHGEAAANIIGSVYRGYYLLLDNHFLPVVLLRELTAKDGQRGLAVADLRIVPMAIAMIRHINDLVRKTVEKHQILEVENLEVKADEFDDLFRTFIPRRANPMPAAVPAPVCSQEAPGASLEHAALPTPATVEVKAALTAENAVPILSTGGEAMGPILHFLKYVLAEAGEKQAFAAFEAWMSDFLLRVSQPVLEQWAGACATPQEFFSAMRSHFEGMGEKFVIIEETPGHVAHEIHDCIYRRACKAAGGFDQRKWGVCTQVIPDVRDKLAAAAGNNLQWVRIFCDQRPGNGCLFDVCYREPTQDVRPG